ncbi:MAG: DNA invertase Pin-like site-specific DNA recombinase [Francisellaceae bacterium]|jgi:DNA invertase Pin-like site-specific DNA recombinase
MEKIASNLFLGISYRQIVLINNQIRIISLNDPIDTTTTQGRLMFNIFASLAEFEKDLIRERTMAALNSARARGKMGGRPEACLKRHNVKLVWPRHYINSEN